MSWKKYGGIQQLEKAKHLNVNSVATDKLTIRENYEGNFGIAGNLSVSKDIDLSGDLEVSGDLVVGGNVTFQAEINPERIRVDEFMNVPGTSLLQDKIYFVDLSDDQNESEINVADLSNNVFLFGTDTNIGINHSAPAYVLDISGSHSQMLRVKAQHDEVRNVMTENKDGYGIVFDVDSSKNTIEFRHASTDVASVNYDPSGTLTIAAPENVVLQTQQFVFKKESTEPIAHHATMTVYDNTVHPEAYVSHVDIAESTTTGTALQLVSQDVSSNTFLSVVNRQEVGWKFGGGVYPHDSQRNLGTLGWTDTCSNHYVFDESRYVPVQNMVSGSSLVKTRGTLGINTYQPMVDQYVLDVNGPVKIGHNEIHEVADVPFEITSVAFSKTSSFASAVGQSFDVSGPGNFTASYYLLHSNNDGQSWSKAVTTLNSIDIPLKTVTIDTSFTLVYGSNQVLYLYDTSNNVYDNSTLASLRALDGSQKFVVRYVKSQDTRLFYTVFSFPSNKVPYVHNITRNVDGSFEDPINKKDISNNETNNLFNTMTPTSVDGNNYIDDDSNHDFYIVGGDTIIKWTHSVSSNYTEANSVYTSTSTGTTYNSVKVHNNSLIAVGGNVITVSTNLNLNEQSPSFSDVTINNGSFNDVYIFDDNRAIVVGDNAQIYYSTDYSDNNADAWVQLTESESTVNNMGNAHGLFDSNNNIISVTMRSDDVFVFTCVLRKRVKDENTIIPTDYGRTKIFYGYFPSLFFPETAPNVLEVAGNMNLQGNITGPMDISFLTTTDRITMGNPTSASLYVHSLQTNAVDVGVVTMNGNPAMDLSLTDDSYTKRNGTTIDLNKSISLGDENTRIDIRGYLNLLDLSATNIQGSGGGGGGSGGSGVDPNDIVSLEYLTSAPELKETNIEKTSAMFFYINYKGSDDDFQSRATAGAGIYIYNDISDVTGISVDEQKDDGYIRISKYKTTETGAAPQDSFSFKPTGTEKRVRMNIKTLADSAEIRATNDISNYPLMFVKKQVQSDEFRLDDTWANTADYNDDNAEITASENGPYVDAIGHFYVGTGQLRYTADDMVSLAFPDQSGTLLTTTNIGKGLNYTDESMIDLKLVGINPGLYITGDNEVDVKVDSLSGIEIGANGLMLRSELAGSGLTWDPNYTTGRLSVDTAFTNLSYTGTLSILPAYTDNAINVNGTSYSVDNIQDAFGRVGVGVTGFTDLSYTGVLSILPSSETSDVVYVMDTSYTAIQVKRAFGAAFENLSYTGILSVMPTDLSKAVFVVDTYYTVDNIKNAFSGTASFTSIQDISCTGLFEFVPKNGIEQNVISVDNTNYTAVQVQNAFGADFEHLKYKGVLTIDPSGGETSDVLYVVDTSYTAVQVKEALDNVLVTQFTDLSYTGVLSILPASDASDAIFVVDTSYTAAQVKAAFERGPDITIAGDLACRDISYNGTLRMNGSNTVLDISGTTYTAAELNELLSDNSIPVQSFDQGLYVKPGGKVGIGTDGLPTNPNNPLEVVGNIKATSFSSSSDYRLKTEIVTISGSTYSLDNLRPVEYKLKSDQQLHYGFLAHELQQMYPSMVNGVKDGEEMQSIQYQELIPLLVKEIQELKAEVKLLKKEIRKEA